MKSFIYAPQIVSVKILLLNFTALFLQLRPLFRLGRGLFVLIIRGLSGKKFIWLLLHSAAPGEVVSTFFTSSPPGLPPLINSHYFSPLSFTTVNTIKPLQSHPWQIHHPVKACFCELTLFHDVTIEGELI